MHMQKICAAASAVGRKETVSGGGKRQWWRVEGEPSGERRKLTAQMCPCVWPMRAFPFCCWHFLRSSYRRQKWRRRHDGNNKNNNGTSEQQQNYESVSPTNTLSNTLAHSHTHTHAYRMLACRVKKKAGRRACERDGSAWRH
ncbi:hypothetical protein M5D96_000837 [Drosophila gunungcola]|uniref:Uncharacterized protein n=1 Tax=Drosophila gunungcola TaxID=103775 RepID=A0A9P9YX07_9MUSC|nr:hypothetical protein M5D96_000837 [Drosophila gunungcola]